MNILQSHYYIEARFSLHAKILKLKSRIRARPKLVQTPDPLKVEKSKIFENPLKRIRTIPKHEKTGKIESKHRDPSPLLSESFNNYLERHALTTISPAEIINHYIIGNESMEKPSFHESFIEKQAHFKLPMPRITQKISISDLEKLDEELFKKSKKRVKHIIKATKKIEASLNVVGSPLCFAANRKNFMNKSQERQKKRRENSRFNGLRLKSPAIQINTAESCRSLNKSLNI